MGDENKLKPKESTGEEQKQQTTEGLTNTEKFAIDDLVDALDYKDIEVSDEEEEKEEEKEEGSTNSSKSNKKQLRRPTPLAITSDMKNILSKIDDEHKEHFRSILPTEMGITGGLKPLMEESYCFCKEQEAWYNYKNGCWTKDYGSAISWSIQRGILALDGYWIELYMTAKNQNIKNTLKEAIDNLNYIFSLQKHASSKITSINKLLRTHPDMGISVVDMDDDNFYLNVKNGIVDLHTGELLPHDRKMYCSMIAEIDYKQNGNLEKLCPRWIKFLNEITGENQDLIDYLQKIVGYTLTGSREEECFFIMHGTGRNGKSTFIEAISNIMGKSNLDTSYSYVPSRELFLRGKELHPAHKAVLRGKRLIVAEELDNSMLDMGLIKMLTSKDSILEGRGMRENPYNFQPQFKLWFITNSKPDITQVEEGTWRRIHLIPFEERFADAVADKQLGEKLEAEAEGILLWAVQGCLKWQEEGLSKADVVEKATKAFKSTADPLEDFLTEECNTQDINENIDEDNEYIVYTKDLWEAYEEWAGNNKLGKKNFYNTLEAKGYKRDKRRITPMLATNENCYSCFIRIKLKTQAGPLNDGMMQLINNDDDDIDNLDELDDNTDVDEAIDDFLKNGEEE